MYCTYLLDDEEDEKEDELVGLYKEAEMPIEDIILKYQNKLLAKKNEKEKDQAGSSKESSSSKPKSTCMFIHNYLYIKCIILVYFNIYLLLNRWS